MSLLSLPGYQIQVIELEDGQFYWHVLLRDERINGGLSRNWTDAQQDAAHAARSDMIHRKMMRPGAERWI